MVWFLLYFIILSCLATGAFGFTALMLNRSERKRGELSATVWKQDEQIRLLSGAIVEQETHHDTQERR